MENREDATIEVFGRRMREARVIVGLSQAEISSALEVSEQALRNYERGRIPKTKVLKKIETVLQRPLAWFFADGENWQLVQRGANGDAKIKSTVGRARARLAETDNDLKEIEALVGAEEN